MLKPPAKRQDAVPTLRGWEDPRTGEILVSRKHSERQIVEYFNYHNMQRSAPAPAPTPAPAPAPAPEPIIEADPEPEAEAEMLTEADPVDYSAMSKAQLAEHAALEHGIELDTSMTKAAMIRDLESQI